jgi:hypothetical protein
LGVADAHVHFFSHAFFEALTKQKPGLTLDQAQQTLAWELPPPPPTSLAERWVTELDRHGVHSAAIIASVVS